MCLSVFLSFCLAALVCVCLSVCLSVYGVCMVCGGDSGGCGSGCWSGLVYYKQVPMLSAENKDAKVLDVKTVRHNFQKRKLVLLEDGNVYKIKKSKLEDNVKPALTLH